MIMEEVGLTHWIENIAMHLISFNMEIDKLCSPDIGAMLNYGFLDILVIGEPRRNRDKVVLDGKSYRSPRSLPINANTKNSSMQWPTRAWWRY